MNRVNTKSTFSFEGYVMSEACDYKFVYFWGVTVSPQKIPSSCTIQVGFQLPYGNLAQLAIEKGHVWMIYPLINSHIAMENPPIL